MSDAELVIRLIGDATPEEQSAIASPPVFKGNGDAPERPQQPVDRTASAPRDTTAASAQEPTKRSTVTSATQDLQGPPKEEIDASTANSFDVSVRSFGAYVDKLLLGNRSQPASRSDSTAQQQPQGVRGSSDAKPVSASDGLKQWLTDQLEQRVPLARTVMGRYRRAKSTASQAVKHVQQWASRPGTSRMGNAARSVVSRFIGPRAAQATTKMATRAATSVASGATSAVANTASAAGAAAAPIAPPVIGGSTATASAAIPALNVAVGAAVASFAALTLSAKVFNDAMVQAADSVERFSPDVSLSRANRMMTTELNMLDRAQRIGPEVSRFEDAKNRISDQGEKLWTSILETLTSFTPVAEKFLEIENAKMSVLRLGVDKVNSGLNLLKVIPGFFSKDVDWKKDVAKKIVDVQKEVNRTKVSVMAQFMKVLGFTPPPELLKPRIDPMLQGILDAEFDDDGNLKPKK